MTSNALVGRRAVETNIECFRGRLTLLGALQGRSKTNIREKNKSRREKKDGRERLW